MIENGNRDLLKMKPIQFISIWKEVPTEQRYQVVAVGIAGHFQLDAVSSLVWRLLDGRNTVCTIIEYVQKEYPDAEQKEIEKDIVNLLIQMEKDDLIISDYNPLNPDKKLNIPDKNPNLFDKSKNITKSKEIEKEIKW